MGDDEFDIVGEVAGELLGDISLILICVLENIVRFVKSFGSLSTSFLISFFFRLGHVGSRVTNPVLCSTITEGIRSRS